LHVQCARRMAGIQAPVEVHELLVGRAKRLPRHGFLEGRRFRIHVCAGDRGETVAKWLSTIPATRLAELKPKARPWWTVTVNTSQMKRGRADGVCRLSPHLDGRAGILQCLSGKGNGGAGRTPGLGEGARAKAVGGGLQSRQFYTSTVLKPSSA